MLTVVHFHSDMRQPGQVRMKTFAILPGIAGRIADHSHNRGVNAWADGPYMQIADPSIGLIVLDDLPDLLGHIVVLTIQQHRAAVTYQPP